MISYVGSKVKASDFKEKGYNVTLFLMHTIFTCKA